jgi:hypothetical protein
MSNVLYLIGSLRNERIPKLAARLREEHPDLEVFDDWYAAGPEADDYWKEYEQAKGSSYQEALRGYSARNVFEYDRRHLDRCTHAILVLPAGKSGHMEIMYATYAVKAKTAILLDPTDVRWDVMYQFVPTILNNDEEISPWLTTPSSQAEKTTVINPEWTYSPGPLSKDCLVFSDSERRSMPHITGGVVSNIRDSSEQP